MLNVKVEAALDVKAEVNVNVKTKAKAKAKAKAKVDAKSEARCNEQTTGHPHAPFLLSLSGLTCCFRP